MIRADEALRLGLLLEVTEPGEALGRALEIAATISGKGPQAIRWAKQAIALSEELDLPIGLQEEAELFALCFETEDQKEGMGAFLEKRAADFKGR